MFIIAGVSPKIKTLEATPRLCPVCGLAQAYLKRIDHYFSLFFIPILRVKKGEPTLICERCERNVPETTRTDASELPARGMCQSCGRTIQADFKYCPYCGKQKK